LASLANFFVDFKWKISFKGFSLKKKMKESDFLLFVQSISEFLKVNNDLAFCIESSVHCVKNDMKIYVRKMITRLNQGESFSSAMENINFECEIFPKYAIRIIKVGEKNKSFVETFEMLKDFICWNIEQKKKLKTALSYPIFTFFVFVTVLFLFANYVVPSILGLLTMMNPENASNYKIFFSVLLALKIFVFLIAGFGIFVFGSYFYDRNLFEKIVFSIPIFGEFLKCKVFYINSYYLYSSLNNGITILESLNIAIECSEGITKDVLVKVKDDAIKGVKVNESIGSFGFIPKIIQDLIKTGENSGNLANAFFLIKQIFFSKYQLMMDKFINVFPTIVVSFTACMMIGFVFLVFVPLYNFR